MSYFLRLFVKAPFSQLSLHMEKVLLCLSELQKLFGSLDSNAKEVIHPIVEKISQYEHDADLVKNDIRTVLPRSFLFPIDRSHFLEILSNQDTLADTAQDIAHYLALKPFTFPKEFQGDVDAYLQKNIQIAKDIGDVVLHFDQLSEATFGGREADRMRRVIDAIAAQEHDVYAMKQNILQRLYQNADQFPVADFTIMAKVFEEIALISHTADKLSQRIGMLLVTK